MDNMSSGAKECCDAIFLAVYSYNPAEALGCTWAGIIDQYYSGELGIFQYELFLIEQVYRMYFCQLYSLRGASSQ